MCRRTKNKAAWIAATAAIAPPLSFAPRSDRYATPDQRGARPGVAAVERFGLAEPAALAPAAVACLAAFACNFTLLFRAHRGKPTLRSGAHAFRCHKVLSLLNFCYQARHPNAFTAVRFTILIHVSEWL